MPIPESIIPPERQADPMDVMAEAVIAAANRYLRALIDGVGRDEAGAAWEKICKEAKK